MPNTNPRVLDTQFNFNLSSKQMTRLQVIARKLGMTPSCLLRILIDQSEHTPIVKSLTASEAK